MPRPRPASRKRANAQTTTEMAAELLDAMVLEIQCVKGSELTPRERQQLEDEIKIARRFYFQTKMLRGETVLQRIAALKRLSRLIGELARALDETTPLSLATLLDRDFEPLDWVAGNGAQTIQHFADLKERLRELSARADAAVARLSAEDDEEDPSRIALSPLGILLMIGAIAFLTASGVRPTAYVDRDKDTYTGNFIGFAWQLAASVGEVGRDALGKTASQAIREALAPRKRRRK
jgi:hypothetical protein